MEALIEKLYSVEDSYFAFVAGVVAYAKENIQVNSIQLIRQLPDKTTGIPKLKRLDLSDFEVQEKITLANSDEDLARIFEEKGYEAHYGGLF